MSSGKMEKNNGLHNRTISKTSGEFPVAGTLLASKDKAEESGEALEEYEVHLSSTAP